MLEAIKVKYNTRNVDVGPNIISLNIKSIKKKYKIKLNTTDMNKVRIIR